jgi:DNA-binding CsgD family transcriptional regulator
MPQEPQEYLRPEARPTDWPDLDRAQIAACARILRALAEATRLLAQPEPPEAPRPQDPGARLSADRSSRILFLSGGRGTGKTTVLTTLMRATSVAITETICAARVPDDFSRNLEMVRQHVVWLEPLDMEPAPRSLNLLPAILARVNDAVTRVGLRVTDGGSNRETSYRGLLEVGQGHEDALMRLQRLQTSTAIGWESNLRARAAQLDPDSYAVEVMRAERSRLSLGPELEAVLEALAYEVFRTHRARNPLFVLPIDDFDLSPSDCVPLLRLLRMISGSRFFALVLGDLSVAEVILNLSLSSDLAMVAGSAARDNLLGFPVDEVQRVGTDLAANALRKLVPPGQRVDLESLDIREGLNFRPLHPRWDNPQRLHDLLAQFEVDLSRRSPDPEGGSLPWNFLDLRDYLLFPRVPVSEQTPAGTELTDSDVPQPAYSGLDFFATTPRRATDLWLELAQDITERNSRPVADSPQNRVNRGGQATSGLHELLEIFSENARMAVMEERAFSPEERRVAREAVERHPTEALHLEELPIVRVPQVGEAAVLGRRTLTPPRIPCEFLLRRFLGWRTRVWLSDEGKESSRRPSRETTASLVLLHDLYTLQTGGTGHLEELRRGSVSAGGFAATRWLTAPDAPELWWPLPSFATNWELEIFLHSWNNAAGVRSAHEDSAERNIIELVTYWTALGTAVCTSSIADLRFLAANPELDLSRHLLDELMLLARRRDQRARNWLIALAELRMPEFALPPSAFFDPGTELVRFWRQEAEVIRQRRANILGRLAGIGHEVLAEELRTAPLPKGFDSRFQPSEPLAIDARLASLSERERDILRQLIQGHSNREIGRGLGVAASTVGGYISEIFKKLKVTNRHDAADLALRAGLSQLDRASKSGERSPQRF